uniref:Uncharacterized protein n=1 Tax=Mycena chlorophos TaxID=658473 RepID=A0ABQ0MCQ2_MYCCL|nr:predicted protein [Mycena chlorophos]
MHWGSLNWPDIMLGLHRGTIECQAPDDKRTWTWMVLVGNAWVAHGEAVEAATPYLPGSFGKAPRNPEAKISSGYKAWEFLLYITGLAPALFKLLLPEAYWIHFCQGVYIIRFFHQRRIPHTELERLRALAIDWVVKFEDLYYQRMTERLHFMRQSVHLMLHLVLCVFRLGPPCNYSQWTMERCIGLLVQELRQPSNLYGNLSEWALIRAQLNALFAMNPKLDIKARQAEKLPQYSHDLGKGFVLLRRRDRYAIRVEPHIAAGICSHLHLKIGDVRLKRWARMRLPNGQIARSLFGEAKLSLQNIRCSRVVKLLPSAGTTNGRPRIVTVAYFFLAADDHALALGTKFSPPDEALLTQSHGTVWSSKGPDEMIVFEATHIESVVGMVPWVRDGQEEYFLVEKPGLELATLGGYEEDDTEELEDNRDEPEL